jgi:hypothetical protein
VRERELQHQQIPFRYDGGVLVASGDQASHLHLLPPVLLPPVLLLLLLLLQDPSQEDGDEATYLYTAEIAEASLSNAALLAQLSPAFTTFAREVNAAKSLTDDVTETLPTGVSILRAGTLNASLCW